MRLNMLQSQLICYNLLLKVHQIIPTSVLQNNVWHKPKAGKGKIVFPERSAQQRFKREGTAPRSNPSKKTIYDWKGSPFVYLLLTNGTPFTYLLWNFTSLLPGVKCGCLTFKYEKITKPERFLDFFTAIKRVYLLGLFTNRNDRFPYPFHILQLVKWSPFHIPEA